MKASTTKKLLIAAVAALSTVVVAGTTAFAIYTNHQLSQSNELTVGKTVDTVVLDAGSVSGETEMYPGEAVTISYGVSIENHTGDVKVTWELKNEDSADISTDFSVAVKQGETDIAANDTAVVDGTNLVFTITMNSRDAAPEYDSVTLSVTLVI